MARSVQRSFAGGEISPALYGRADTAKYQTGLATCRNFVVQRYGGVTNRTGSEFVAEVKDSTKATRLLKFVFNADQTYVLEFGDQYMRVHRQGVQLSDLSLTVNNITQANPAVLTYTGTDPSNGQEIYVSGVAGMTEVNGRNFKIANVNAGANTLELQDMTGTNLNSTGYGAYTSGGTANRVYEIATPYVTADLRDLQFFQSGDVVTIVHPSYAPRDLVRSGHTSWTLSTITFAPTLAAPGGLGVVAGAAGALAYKYQVTSISAETYEESLPSAAASCNCAVPTQAAPNVLTWTQDAAALEYYVYRETYIGSGVYGYLGIAAQGAAPTFKDVGILPDTTSAPPTARTPFNAADAYPSTGTYFQQRRAFANTNNEPEKVWTTRSGQYTNLTTSSPIQDDDAVTFTIAGRQVNEVRHLIELNELLVFTSGAVWRVEGDADGVLKPTAINLKMQAAGGSAALAPCVINNSVVYLQARGSIVRDLRFDWNTQGFASKELSIYAPHLFDGYQITAWDYQEIPHSVVWAVRNEGTLLGLTYLPDQELWGWHRHDTDGTYEDVVCVPEGEEDAVYVLGNRTIGGVPKRYIERFRSRRITAIEDAFFVDSGLSYDGRNTDAAHTMTLSGGTTWAYTEDLTLTSSAAYFTAAEVGNAIVLTAGADSLTCTIIGYTNSTTVTVQANRDVPVAFQGVALAVWARAADTFTGLWHLEGKDVSVLADGSVVPGGTVTNGTISLQRPAARVSAGLPITADFETLDIDNAQSGEIRPRTKLIKQADLLVESSRGIWAGPDADHLTLYKQRDTEGSGVPTAMDTGLISINLQATWAQPGRVFVRQPDPLPVTILALFPNGELGG